MKTRYTEGDGTIERARTLRREPTPAEDKLWSVLRGRGLERAKFRRQPRFGKFVADFVCLASRLIVEVDGDTWERRRCHTTHAVLRFSSRKDIAWCVSPMLT